MVKSICGTYKIVYHPDGEEGQAVEIDFTPPWKRVPLYSTLEEVLKVKLPPPDQLGTAEAAKMLSDLCNKMGVECPPPRTPARLLDKVLIF